MIKLCRLFRFQIEIGEGLLIVSLSDDALLTTRSITEAIQHASNCPDSKTDLATNSLSLFRTLFLASLAIALVHEASNFPLIYLVTRNYLYAGSCACYLAIKLRIYPGLFK